MRKCDWCRNNPECRGVKVSECIVRDYRNFVPYENGGTCRGNRAKMSIYEDAIDMCESCIHKKVCRFEVPIGEKCNDYIKEEWFGGETST